MILDNYYVLGYDINHEGDSSPWRPNPDEDMGLYYNSLNSSHQYLNDWDSGIPHEVLLHMKPKKRPKNIYKEKE